MKKSLRVLRVVSCVFVVSPLLSRAAGQELPPVLKNYKPVTAQRLLKPEENNWLTVRRTYDGWGYSPLDKIDTRNVSRLKQVWTIDTGETRVHEAAPVVNGGAM